VSHAETWLAYDFAIIDRCTHVLMMPRWESSVGAIREQEYAQAIGVPVFFSADELARAVDARPTEADEGKVIGSAT
jgi:hypothetical protein